MANSSGVRTGWIFAAGLVSAALFVTAILWLHSYFEVSRNNEIYRKVLSVQNVKLRELRAQEAAQLNSYGWVDQQKGVAHIPIDRAMELMAKEARERRASQAGG